ncbi:hypothetical protein LSTR_LSTR009382 [Laodelphax striatellus]|uniref:Uncharacterized protein n=1 Tax=Laodelphax striatellus TaxID=195883 RepID=A0A482XMI8_LAOST|nr:hypothetical protein LSTR_LSTR009382 [Laodelphax striatellus]
MEDITQYDRKALLPKITIDLGSDKITLDAKTIENYFDIEKPKIYKCSKDSESFLKVVNEVRGKSGVRKVFHQDGVKVLRHSIGLNTLSARIIEQKYLDPTDFNVLKFAGKLVME